MGDWAFADCINLTNVTLPNSLTCINASTFYLCENLNSVNIPNSVTTIEEAAFDGCTALESIIIPNSVNTIGLSAFGECTSLKTITIPNSVTIIDRWAFTRCTNLTTAIIGDGIKKIDHSAFSDCEGLTDFYCYAESVPTTDYEAFLWSNYTNATLHVPSASITTYKTQSPWNRFKSIVALTDSDPLPNGINVVRIESHKTNIFYDFSGRKMQAPKKGFYIMNGKKYIKK